MTGARIRELAAAARELPDGARDIALRNLLRTEVHNVVMRMTVDSETPRFEAVAEIATAVRDSVPDGIEDRVGPRIRVFVRLLRRDFLEPAWVLAHDNASGVVRPTRAASMWAGGSHLSTALPLPTLIEGNSVYAWLPGLRDPRWQVPDEVYTIDRDVVLRSQLDYAVLRSGRLFLAGTAFLGLLEARAEDEITLAFAGPGEARHRAQAVRARRSDHVKPAGPDLTRLAWSGWYADVPLAPLFAAPGAWRVTLELVQQGLVRTQSLGRRRGPLAQPELVSPPHESRGRSIRLDQHKDGGLLVRVVPLGASARIVPRRARTALRRLAAS